MPTWTMEERSRLLLTIIELLAPPKSTVKMPPWPHVADKMGSGFSGEAVRQQYQKLRKEGLPGGRKQLKRFKKGITNVKPERTDEQDDEEYNTEDDEPIIRKRIKREKAESIKMESDQLGKKEYPHTPPPSSVNEVTGQDMNFQATERTPFLETRFMNTSLSSNYPVPALDLKEEGVPLGEGGDELYAP